jgi:preprotein translocase subunit YajC
MSFLISSAKAAEAGAGGMDPGILNILYLFGFGLIFYFFMRRPQAKRAKDHKNLISSLAKGDEVLTAGGIIGKVAKVSDDYVVLEVCEGTQLSYQKAHVAAALPKGTIKNI